MFTQSEHVFLCCKMLAHSTLISHHWGEDLSLMCSQVGISWRWTRTSDGWTVSVGSAQGTDSCLGMSSLSFRSIRNALTGLIGTPAPLHSVSENGITRYSLRRIPDPVHCQQTKPSMLLPAFTVIALGKWKGCIFIYSLKHETMNLSNPFWSCWCHLPPSLLLQ